MKADLHKLHKYNINQKEKNPLIISAVTEPKKSEKKKKNWGL